MSVFDQQEPWITSYLGRKIYLRNPDIDRIDIIDIAHALSLICRYNGRTKKFYSVAEHCIHCACLTSNEFKLEALMHDAAEAYLGDVTRPLKMLLPDYKKLEKKWEKAIRERFNLYPDEIPEVDHNDGVLCATEMKKLFIPLKHEQPLSKVSLDESYDWFVFNNFTPEEAEKQFLNIFEELYKIRMEKICE